MTEAKKRHRGQLLVGAAIFSAGVLLAWGASQLPSQAGYAGLGPNAVPWMVGLGLMLCGALAVLQAWRGGWRAMPALDGLAPDLRAGAWMVAGVLANAALITRIGFVLACALCYALAVRGLRVAEGQQPGARRLGMDLLVGMLISAPVYWLFARGLSVQLPALTTSGWI